MYKIDSLTLKQYVEDEFIKIPRFQRAKTWKTRQFFELVLSIFKGYPLGCIILCQHKSDNRGREERWLIDGRQRYSTVKEIFNNPVIIYEWAKKYLEIKDGQSDSEIEDKFWTIVEEFTNYDPNDKSDDEPDESDILDEDGESLILNENAKQLVANTTKEDLKSLIQFITFCKRYKKSGSYGLTSVFDIRKYVEYNGQCKSKILGNDNNLSCQKIKSLIKQYKDTCKADGKDYKIKENFLEYLSNNFTFLEGKKEKYLNEELSAWEDKQLKSISFFEMIDNLLGNTFIASITISGVSSTDEQKIFNLINSNGTPLTAAEVLSAKPSWNKPVDINSSRIKKAVQKLYKDQLQNDDIISDNYVRWDLPASLTLLLDNFDAFFPIKEYSDKKSGKFITLGFKIASGVLLKGIKKDDLDKLSDDSRINGEDFNNLIETFNDMLRLLADMQYFQVIKSWKFSLSKIIGDNPTLAFLFSAYHLYNVEDRPHSGTASFNIFKKNCFIILDKLIYEYANSRWRGSSDTLVSKEIKDLEAKYEKGKILSAISNEDWKKLISEVINNNQINRKDITIQLIKPLVVHYYCIKNLKCDVTYDFIADFDHIIPQALFKSSNIDNKELIRDNIYNIALLPKSKNTAKNDKPLAAITDKALKTTIEKYEEIPQVDFTKYSEVTDWAALKEYRGNKIIKGFDGERTEILNAS